MKKLITVSLLLISISISFSQSKKKQIETLTYKLDSINSVLLRSIDDNEKLSDTKLALESKISLLKNEIESKDDKIESLTKEVKSWEQDYQLVIADLILKSDSLDSISHTLDSIIEKLKVVPSSDYLLTNYSVGYFKIDDSWQNIAKNKYDFKSIQGFGTCIDACCDGGFDLGKVITNSDYGMWIENPVITIGASSFSKSASETQYKSNPNVFYISSDNCNGWYWKDKISYLVVYSAVFKTKEGIGVGTTLEKVQELLGKVVINIEEGFEAPNTVQFKINSYPNIEFILDEEDAIGGWEKLGSVEGKTATISDFKKNTKIKRIIIRPGVLSH